MSHDHRIPSPAPGPARGNPSPPFFRVERRSADGRTTCSVVHTQSPKFLVEFESDPAPVASDKLGGGCAARTPVIRRVCVPNSWAGEYHLCARQLGAAAAFFAATDRPDA